MVWPSSSSCLYLLCGLTLESAVIICWGSLKVIWSILWPWRSFHTFVYACMCFSCYGMALKQQPSVPALWHDLGVCYYHLLKVVEGHSVKVMASKCMESLKQALTLDPSSHCYWNALGVTAAHPGSSLFSYIFCFLYYVIKNKKSDSCSSHHCRSKHSSIDPRILKIIFAQ